MLTTDNFELEDVGRQFMSEAIRDRHTRGCIDYLHCNAVIEQNSLIAWRFQFDVVLVVAHSIFGNITVIIVDHRRGRCEVAGD